MNVTHIDAQSDHVSEIEWINDTVERLWEWVGSVAMSLLEMTSGTGDRIQGFTQALLTVMRRWVVHALSGH